MRSVWARSALRTALAAAAPWSEPLAVPGGSSGGVDQLRFDDAGHGLLIGLGVGGVLAAPVEGGRPGPAVQSATGLSPTTLVRIYGRDGVVAGGDRPGTAHAALARGRLGRPLGRPQPLRGRSRSSQLLDLAVNEAGDAVAVVRWCRTRGCGRQTLALFRWRAGARIGRPRSIARGPDGRVLIAWSGNEGSRWVVRAGELGPACWRSRGARRREPSAPPRRSRTV